MATVLRIMLALLVIPFSCLGWSGECVGIVDGDTIDVMNGTTRERIRLYGIDCPERKQDFFQKATDFTADMVFNKTVEIIPVKTERRYGKERTIAYVNVDGRSLNKELLKVGMAWWFKRYAPKDHDLEEFAKEACQAKLGLWSHPNPCPPWVWRKDRAKCSEYEGGCDFE